MVGESSYPECSEMSRWLDEAIDVGIESQNLLLLDYCDQLIGLEGGRSSTTLAEIRTKLAGLVEEARLVRWLDTALTDQDATVSQDQLIIDKIERTVRQIESIRSGTGYICDIVVPALNEGMAINVLIDSFRSQVCEVPPGSRN